MEIDNLLKKLHKESSKDIRHKDYINITPDLLFKKVAFDLYRVDNDPYDGLWTIADVDGKSSLVRTGDPVFEQDSSGDWSAISDYDRENITLAYRNVPLARFSSSEFGFSKDDIMTFKSALLDRASQDEEFMRHVFATQPKGKIEALSQTFPELKKFI